ncbi:FAD-dependent monooxygenase roqM [Lachnellula suecica]|uniref:FAD-dependent monooxygenase roqM n=1 Tax=Lachnellula suecica TaxID=602035 RepID=A0A8T9CHS9_9HELO|nr:FAD-dependent monooxygenase roqM [Lachnellula suecica]
MATYERLPESGIRVIVVGSGFAGLTAAIECHRKGHSVLLLDSFPELKILGDIISFAPNSGRIFQRWPGVDDKLDPIIHKSDGLTMKTWKGDTLFKQEWKHEEGSYGKAYNGHRGEIHEIVYQHALDIGVDIRLSHKVEDYFETETEAGVIANGERFVGDVVLAADGVRSKGRTIVLGYEDKPKSSGYAIYRTWFDSAKIAEDPEISWMVTNGDKHCAWLGPDIHFIAASVKNGKDFSWVCTHKDEADVKESWQAHAPLADARKVLAGWDPMVQKILDATPDPLIDWKLVYREPLPTWISPKKRIALIGDAAHPFLPTSIQGASQAMEDGATLGVCLSRCGKANIKEGIAAFEALRYERVRAAQKTGETTRDTWHKADWDEVKKNPDSMKLKREEWLLNFDAEDYAEKNYAATVALLNDTGAGREFNVPKMTVIAASA